MQDAATKIVQAAAAAADQLQLAPGRAPDTGWLALGPVAGHQATIGPFGYSLCSVQGSHVAKSTKVGHLFVPNGSN